MPWSHRQKNKVVATSFRSRLTKFWVALDLDMAYQRRNRRVQLVSSSAMVVVGLFWGLYFLALQQWAVVACDALLIASGGLALRLCWTHQSRLASLVLFCSMYVIVVGNAVILDAPSMAAPRTTHLYLIPLSLGAVGILQDESVRIRYGAAIAYLATFVVLSASPVAPFPELALADSIRGPGGWVQSAFACTITLLTVHLLHVNVVERSELELELLAAVSGNQFELFYQPQVDSRGNLTGAEALIRWRHPDKGLLAPGHFIGTAEQSGLILPMGQWVMETACQQLQDWAGDAQRRQWTLAVNVSHRQFLQADFADRVRALLARYTFDASRLELEITESMLIEDFESMRRTMQAITALGVRFALDDFGTGYSSLQYLQRLPVHKLKIDRSFVTDALVDGNSQAIVRAIMALGESLGLEVLAEGVEMPEQLGFLQAQRCGLFQGYLFSPAIPVRDFEAWAGKGCIPAQPVALAVAA